MYTFNNKHKNSDFCVDYVFWKKFLALQTTLHILFMPCSHVNEKHCFCMRRVLRKISEE